MHTIETTVYTFSELDDLAKEHARDWYRHGIEFDFDHVIDMAKDAGRMIGIDASDVYFSGFCSQGDGACFAGSYAYAKGSAAAVRKEFPQDEALHAIADTLAGIQRAAFYGLSASVTHDGRYCHEHSTSIHVDVDDDRRWPDESTCDEIADALRDFMRWIYKRLESEWEYQNSDEAIDDMIEANEYTFTETGQRFG